MIPLLFFVTYPTWLAIAWRKYFRMRSRPSHTGTPRRIIIFRLDQLGDLVLTTPLFRELKRLYPDARTTVVVRPQYKAILTTNRNVDEILPLHELRVKWLPERVGTLASTLWFYWSQLRRREFDLAISPRFDVDENLATMLCALTHAGKRVGHSSHSTAAKAKVNRGFDSAFDIVIPPSPPQHELDRNLGVITAFGGKVENRGLEIRLTENDRYFADELLKHHDPERLLIAIGIGGRAPGRRWPLDRYADCIACLNRHRKIQPVIVCSSEEDADASALSVKLPVPPYILSGVPLRAVCAVLERCDLFVGNDTGTVHLAAAMECPIIVISRHPANGDPAHPNSPARFAPRCRHYQVLQPHPGRGGCCGSCRSASPHCILAVTVGAVVDSAGGLLAGSLTRPFLRLATDYQRSHKPGFGSGIASTVPPIKAWLASEADRVL